MLSCLILSQQFFILIIPKINICQHPTLNLTDTIIRTLIKLNLFNNSPGISIRQRMPLILNINANLDWIIPLIRRFPCRYDKSFCSLHCRQGSDVPEAAFFVQEMTGFKLDVFHDYAHAHVEYYYVVPHDAHLVVHGFLAHSECVLEGERYAVDWLLELFG